MGYRWEFTRDDKLKLGPAGYEHFTPSTIDDFGLVELYKDLKERETSLTDCESELLENLEAYIELDDKCDDDDDECEK
jgi:hypothetical protein